jgi:hypothetical protein
MFSISNFNFHNLLLVPPACIAANWCYFVVVCWSPSCCLGSKHIFALSKNV